MFEQWLNDVIWFQHSSKVCADITQPVLSGADRQHDRLHQTQLIKGEETPDPILVSNMPEYMHSISAIQSLIEKIARDIPPQTHIEIGGDGHVVGVFKINDGEYKIYDSNCPTPRRYAESASDLAQLAIDIKYDILEKIMDYFVCLSSHRYETNNL